MGCRGSGSHSLIRNPSTAKKRLALVIGNKDYKHLTDLDNPINDAVDLATKLRDLEFEVALKTNTTFEEMESSCWMPAVTIPFPGRARQRVAWLPWNQAVP